MVQFGSYFGAGAVTLLDDLGIKVHAGAPLLAWAGEIENPVLLIHGEKAHSLYFSEYAYGPLKPT